MPAQYVSCDPATLVGAIPCLDCLSSTQLEMLQVLAYAIGSGFTLPRDLDSLLQSSGCLSCLSKKQKLEAETKILLFQAGALTSTDPETAIEMLKCFPCLNAGQVHALLLYLKCQYFNNRVPQ